MAAFICRYCGAPLELSGTTVCECQSCNILQSVPLIDSAEKRELLTRAEQLRREQRYDKAIQLYEKMITLSPTDADLYWALALCRYGVLFFADGGSVLQRTQAHSFTSDSDYQQALKFADEKQRGLMEHIAGSIDEKQREISELSIGKSYDVLLCSGADDKSVKCSTELYSRLCSENMNVFYPQVTLKETAKSEWEPFLFSAVYSAKVLIIAVTDRSIFDDVLAMNLCGRFMSGSMSGRAVIPVLYGVPPEELPSELTKFQALNAASLGFEQDLAASVKALISGVRSNGSAQKNSPLVRRAYIMLSDRQFSEAAAMCGRIELQSPGEAALIRLLCEYRLTDEESLETLSADIMQSENYRIAMQYGSEALRLKLKKYALCAQKNLQSAQQNDNGNKSTDQDFNGANEVYSAKVTPLKKHSRLTVFAAALALTALAAAAVIVISHNGSIAGSELTASEPILSEQEAGFERAKALFDEGKYVEAEAAFVSLGNDGENGEWADKCRYMQAEQYLSSDDIEDARGIFLRLGDYGDSAEKVNACDYRSAEIAEENGEFESAAEAFDALGAYSDSKMRRKECLYKQAGKLLDSGELDSAEAVFREIEYYHDSADKLKDINYKRAEMLLENGEYYSAYEKFGELDGWSDSAARAKDSLYQYARSLFEAKDFHSVISPLTELGDYLDSRDMLNAAWLERALEQLDGHDKRHAYSTLTFRVEDGYAPAQPYITALRNELLNGADWSWSFYLGKYPGSDPPNDSSISWIVLKREGGMALVVTENALEYLPFDADGGTSWNDSSLRSWLNGDFYQNAFTDDEKALIVKSASGSSADNVFLLSSDEAAAMFTRAVSPTKYIATIYTQLKIPKGSEIYSWGRNGLISGNDELSPTQPGLVFPAMWVRIE